MPLPRLSFTRFAALLAVFTLALAAGCGDDDESTTNPPAGAVEDTVRIVAGASQLGANAYSPNPNTVTVGTTVRWINNDSMQHTVTNDTGTSETFDLVLSPTVQRTRKFDNAGSFPYHCRIAGHNMSGTIVVVP